MQRKYTDVLKESHALIRGTVLTEKCGKSHKVKDDTVVDEGAAAGLKAMKTAGKGVKDKAAKLLKQRNMKMSKRAAAFETLTVSDMMGDPTDE